MAVKKKNTTADGDQGTKVGGSDVTVTHNSNEPLVTVAVQTTPVLPQQVTVVVKLNGNKKKQNCSNTEGETPRSPPKTNPWNEFLKQNKGRKLTMPQLSALYQDEKKKTQHASLITDGSSGA